MSILLIVFITLMVFHFVYETIIAPVVRIFIRYRLFALRDRLRDMHYRKDGKIDQKVFEVLEISINNLTSFISRVSIYHVSQAEEYVENNPTVMNELNKKIEILAQCDDEEVLKIRKANKTLFVAALLINNGMLFLYFLPIVLIIFLASTLVRKFLRMIQEVFYLPENELMQIIAPNGIACRG